MFEKTSRWPLRNDTQDQPCAHKGTCRLWQKGGGRPAPGIQHPQPYHPHVPSASWLQGIRTHLFPRPLSLRQGSRFCINRPPRNSGELVLKRPGGLWPGSLKSHPLGGLQEPPGGAGSHMPPRAMDPQVSWASSLSWFISGESLISSEIRFSFRCLGLFEIGAWHKNERGGCRFPEEVIQDFLLPIQQC